MPGETTRDWILSNEQAEPEEQWVILCFLAGQAISLDPEDRNGALRRAELLLATGGDPRRQLELYGRAVTAVADDLDAPAIRAALAAGLDALVPEAVGVSSAEEALRLLRADPDLAWQCYAMAILADELAGDG